MNFEKDLAEGQEFERLALRLLGPGWSRNPDRYGPDLLHPTLGPCECKFDRRAHVTGKVFFETSYRGQDSGVFKYPGLKRWMQGSRAGALLLRMDDLFFLVNFRGKRIRGGDRGDSEGVLLPWQSLKEFCEKSFDTEALTGNITVAYGQNTFSPYPHMGLIASAPKQERFLIPADSYPARCFQLVDLGTHFNERFNKHERKVRVVWELPSVLHKFKDDKEEPAAIGNDYSVSLAPKANLRADLEAWRGKPFTDQEVAGFDLRNIVGTACLVQVSHYEKSGETKHSVEMVSKLPSVMTCPPAVNQSLVYDIETDGFGEKFLSLPNWMQEKIKKSKEYKDAQGSQDDAFGE